MDWYSKSLELGALLRPILLSGNSVAQLRTNRTFSQLSNELIVSFLVCMW